MMKPSKGGKKGGSSSKSKKKSLLSLPSLQRTLDGFVVASPQANNKRKNCNSDEEENPTKRSNNELVVNSTSLTPEQKSMIHEKKLVAQLRRLSHEYILVSETTVGLSWFDGVLEQEFRKPYFKKLDDFYRQECSRATVYPPRDQIFSWTKYCELREVRVVILGQDPYHGPRQAHGLCFSVQRGVASPPSLVNMYKELVSDPGVEGFDAIPNHGCLESWARQGVLLLNAVLSVEGSKPNSHKNRGWENLTTSVVKWISNNLRDVVFLLWGAHAHKMGTSVDKTRHTVLTTVHPSPLSAHKGFLGCRHFSKCNQILREKGKRDIQWASVLND